MALVLALDVGNSNLCIGLFEDDRLTRSFRIFTDRSRTSDEYGMLIKSLMSEEGLSPQQLEGVAISNVVPALQPMLKELSVQHLRRPPVFISGESVLNLTLAIDAPTKLGADLIVAAAEGYARFGGPLIVIHFGTATTISAISAKGEFLGTTIAPGLQVSMEAFYSRAPHLPRIELEPPPKPWGTNTAHSLQAGILMGHACMVDGTVARMQRELGDKATVVATGGLVEVMAGVCKSIDEVSPSLVLQGIRRLYELNKVMSA